MKRILIVVAIIITILTCLKEDKIVIPIDAIRFRVVASSNNINDQTIKNKLSLYIQDILFNLTKNSKSSEETKKILINNREYIDNEINKFLKENKVKYDYKLKIGKNYFPSKNYKGITYEAGYYDSLTIELGKSEGVNWWCVIYPPLCLINEDTTDVEYTSLVKEIINNFSNKS